MKFSITIRSALLVSITLSQFLFCGTSRADSTTSYIRKCMASVLNASNNDFGAVNVTIATFLGSDDKTGETRVGYSGYDQADEKSEKIEGTFWLLGDSLIFESKDKQKKITFETSSPAHDPIMGLFLMNLEENTAQLDEQVMKMKTLSPGVKLWGKEVEKQCELLRGTEAAAATSKLLEDLSKRISEQVLSDFIC